MSENQDGPSSIRVVSEAESDGPGNESEPDDTQVNESMSTGSKKRSREADYSVEQKGKAPKKQTSGNEASTSRQQPKQKETKDDGNKVKNINCKIDRRKKTDKMTDMEVLLWKKLVPFPDSLQIPASFNQIRNEWPLRPDLQKISQKMQDIKTKSNNDVTLDGLNQELDALGKKRKEQERALGAVLNNQVSDEDLESQVCGSWSTFGAEFKSLENQLYEENNTKVSFKDFEGLEEALKKTNAFGLPDYLKPIANQIEEVRGKAAGLVHGCIQILVCAAIKEMQDSALESLNWDTLKKWGVTLNCARQLGFQVSFADELLRKTLVAYMCFKFLINQPDDKNNNQGKFR